MGKKKSSKSKANVFKVAGAKSLKKPKAKAVNLGLKNIKQKVLDIDKQFLEVKDTKTNQRPKPEVKLPLKKENKNVSQQQITKTADELVKMDL